MSINRDSLIHITIDLYGTAEMAANKTAMRISRLDNNREILIGWARYR